MARWQYVTLTVNNLQAPELKETRDNRYGDIKEKDGKQTFEIEILSNHYLSKDRGTPNLRPETFDADSMKDLDEDEQPTIELTRKILGALAVTPAEVTAGQKGVDFEITYTPTEALVTDTNNDGVVDNPIAIEVRLPAGWPAPTPFNYGPNNDLVVLDKTPLTMITEDTGPHVFLGGSVTRVRSHTVSVEGNPKQGSVVRIMLGPKGISSTSLVLRYEHVEVQRMTTDDEPALVEAFSGPPVVEIDGILTLDRVNGLPQFPVDKQEEDIITVELAANDSGIVTFNSNGKPVTSSDTVLPNAENSIPAGLTKEDGYDLIVTYTPDGDMSGEDGAGEFEFRIPSGWSAEDISILGDESSTPDDGPVIAGELR